MKYLFDTNGIVYFLDGSGEFPKDLSRETVFISCITKIELLSGKISEAENEKIRRFLEYITVLNLDDYIIEKTIELRKKLKLKVPDAVIVATAIVEDMQLITADKEIIKKIGTIGVSVLNPLTP